jgi:hypothetical protein
MKNKNGETAWDIGASMDKSKESFGWRKVCLAIMEQKQQQLMYLSLLLDHLDHYPLNRLIKNLPCESNPIWFKLSIYK